MHTPLKQSILRICIRNRKASCFESPNAVTGCGTFLSGIANNLYGRIAPRILANLEHVPLVQANRTAGNLFRDELATALRAEGRTVYTEVYKKTPFGARYMDLEVWHKGVNLGGIEAKVGGSRYLPLQKLKDAWLGTQGYPVQLIRKPGNW